MLRLYFGLEGGREHTLEEIGSMLGVTRERVRQLRDRALKRLREGDVGRALGQLRRVIGTVRDDDRKRNGAAIGPPLFRSPSRGWLTGLAPEASHHFSAVGPGAARGRPLPRPVHRSPPFDDPAHDVYKAFGPKRVLEGFTLDVPEGETMVIIGYSGTGKVRRDQAHRRPARARSTARSWVDGLEVPELSRRELYALRARIGYVFQFAALFDSFTIGENVAMGLRKQDELSEREIAQRVDEALDLVDLPNVADRFPAELSGGMRKRVGIARAIALRPKYILYDEPTTGLDPVTSAVIDQLMVRMREKLQRHRHRHHARHAQRVHRRHAHRHAVPRARPVGGYDRRDQDDRRSVVRQFVEGRPTEDDGGVPGGVAGRT